MRIFGFLFSFGLTFALIYALNTQWDIVPPLGKFLSPFTGFWQNEESDKITYEDQVELTGLTDLTTVLIDTNQVPHIFAKNDEDLYLMQGYIIARDRLWQMEFINYVAAGRVSELVGERALDFDRTQRRLGIPYAAEKAIELLDTDPVSKSVLMAYSKGVNSYIQNLSYKDLPVEYKLLNYYPEEWTPYKCALLLKFMAKMLTGQEYDFEYTNALKLFGKETFDFLYPDFPEGIVPIIPKNYTDSIRSDKDIDSVFLSTQKFSYSPYEKPGPNIGSNNWAVSGKKSITGSPMLCNDPHLGLRIPAIWYQIQLHSPTVNVYGVCLPGAPGITIGFNENIAWGVTNASMDVKDWYKMVFKDDSQEEYLFDKKWLSAKKRIEAIKIRGKETFSDTVTYTHLGPVTYDKSFQQNYSPITPLALRWTAHDPSNEMRTFYELNRAKNYADYLAALEFYECPGQNFVFADKNGDIAIKQQGKFIDRKINQGKFIQDGTTSASAWRGFIPIEDNPHILNPERGFVSSANQHPTDSTYPYHYHGIYEYYRNRRINNILSSKGKFGPDDMKRLQNDNYYVLASEILPYMLDSLDATNMTDEERVALDELLTWNYYYETELVAPTIFEAVWERFHKLLWDEFYPEDEKGLRAPNDYVTVHILKNFPNNEFIDNQSTPEKEQISDLVNQAFRNAVSYLQHWQDSSHRSIQWEEYKGTRLAHWAQIEPFFVRNIPIGGNRHIVNATSKTHGASWRMVVSLGDKPVAWGIFPGGQSGNPGSPYYDNYVFKWAKGEYNSLVFLNEASGKKDQIIFKQIFTAN